MSTWNLGIDDVSDETRAFKDKLSSKDGQIAAQQDRIAKQAADYEELKERLNEALHQLTSETQRALCLESDLQQRTEDLRNERIASDNAKISHTSDEHNARGTKLGREKSMLEEPITPGRRGIPRPRSSSLSDFKITTLEQDLNESRALLANKETELVTVGQKLSQVQGDRLKADNEKMAAEMKWSAQEEELVYLKEQQGDGSREEELLRRIEEDDAKIAALELMLRAEDSQQLKERLRRMEAQLKEGQRRLTATCQGKEEALDELEESRRELHRVVKELHERKARDHAFNEKAVKTLETCDDPLMNDDSCLIDMDTLEPQAMQSSPVTPISHPVPEGDSDTVTQIERLLLAIDRLRGERDSLRRDVQFLESESRFAIEALEAKLSASMSTASNTQTLATIDQLRAEMDDMHAQMLAVGEQYEANTRAKNLEIRRLGVQVQGLAVTALQDCQVDDKQDLVMQYDLTKLSLETIISERDDLLNQLRTKDAHWEKELEAVRQDEQECRERLDEAMREMADLNDQLEDLESDRDSLTLQVTNLTTDLQVAQDELTNAESRYTNLQFHQLNSMTSSEATRTLREHIEELEMRVMRRTEQIGIHQHDIRRLETNLRLQEERLNELMTELEMMAAQKDAMVEDCADAREARDEALTRVEALEDDLEALEGRNSENKALVTSLIAVIADTVSRAREAIRQARSQTTGVHQDLSASQEQRTEVQQELDEKIASLMSLTRESEEHRDELEKELSTLAQSLQEEKAALESQGPDATNTDLQRQLQDRLQEKEQSGSTNEDAERALVQLKLQHAEALGAVQGRLVETESALEELQTRYESSEEGHQRAAEDAKTSIEELEQRLAATTKTLSELRKRPHEKISELQEALSKSENVHQEALQLHESLQAENARLTQELEKVQEEHDTLVAHSREEHQIVQQELERKVQSLQGRFEEETRLLDISKEEAARLALRLSEETEKRAQDHKAHTLALSSANERADKTILQQEITTHEAEVQKSKSLSRYLEAQIKDSDHLVTTLKGDIERLHADLARSEKACKAAEVNLSLQNAQHKRETTEFRRELSALRTRPNLEQALAELEERNTEMEDLLRAKCTEIEENDDRVLEMLKEKKKLTTKVESLTRKVQNLQAKLAAAKASAPASASSPVQPLPTTAPQPKVISPSVALAAQTPQSLSAPFSRPRSATSSSAPHATQSSTASPPSLTRKRSERIRSRAITPVFKARTPERRHLPEVDPMPSAVVIGKKRSAPDDFEVCENMPAQAFTAEGEDVENRTPRVRRVLNSLQSGFTPLRNQNRPTAPMPSPRRTAPVRSSPFISDMTNSPHPIPPMPSSWLGKIRGSSQPAERPSGMKSS
ncbi:hypothetical protein BDZ97DRAFT_1784777 [Flammula alnicola]|nr:hypothetical protein BDZ97DRAFT_1784777 [Flammula alnicola]